MLGAIYGDKAGSIYEFEQTKKIKHINPQNLILPNSFYSDDTIETIAIADAIINNKDYGKALKSYVLKYKDYKPDFSPYFETIFSPNTIKWAMGVGKSDSIGNGAMMRISPVGYLFNSEDEVIENARLATIPTHNSKEAVKCATTIALMIYYFRKGLNKNQVYNKLNLYVNYVPFDKFNTTCYKTLGNCLYAIYNANSFENSITKILLMGGDTDTNACIVGSVSEAIYGLTENQKSMAIQGLPNEYKKVLKKIYK